MVFWKKISTFTHKYPSLGKLVHEIVVFSAVLKAKDCPNDVFLFIDQNMPRHVVFILEYDNQYKVMLNYKQWKDGQNGIFKKQITKWQSELQATNFVNSDKKYTTQWTIETIKAIKTISQAKEGRNE